ncbi:hypothetical protein IP98_01329 [Flavobacterium cauense R2A-7]|uniref:Uncharacterized protein n=1 Tax=Flavobacterium cauense R2A-7 TaxID=1341154 RepID=A0A562LYX8_9FLAO|nr:hypothetical protein [Flavobacterium cauense]KGO80943.1 hypothetical protein Q762_09865 [Flavobacterium cauense R2A-7]TWI12855.1 hypothetical protein IP98_01329 [Flavobacterium cauense R2A-7]
MNNFIEEGFPLEFQQVQKVEKEQTILRNKKVMDIDFYQSNQITPQNFFKPISKIFKFEFD